MVSFSNAVDYVKSNIGTIGAGTGGAIVGGVVGATAATVIANRKKRKKRAKSGVLRKRGHSHKGHRKRRQKYPHTAGKRKDTSHRRIRYTKNNQPYIILRSGKARFIKKRSVSSSKKRKGGKY